MHHINDESSRDKGPFWKKNNRSVPGSMKPVYGAMHPPVQHPSSRAFHTKDDVSYRRQKSNSSSFDDFKLSTDDAWNVDVDDDDEDDDYRVRLNKDAAHSAALSVLSSHSQQVNDKPIEAHKIPDKICDINKSKKCNEEIPPTQSYKDCTTEKTDVFSSPTGSTLNGPGVGIRQPSISTNNQQLSYQYIRQRLTVPDRKSAKLEKIRSLLDSPNTDLGELRQQSWSGIPKAVRAITWRLLSGYLPANSERRVPTLNRKRDEYFNFVKQYYDSRLEDLYQDTYRQIHIDVPRMSPLIPLFQQEKVQEIFERILFIWAIRHPASGYVQGINDLVTPFFVVFLQEAIGKDADVENYDVTQLDTSCLDKIEADSFWLMSKLLDGIQDNYTFAQPGIQIKVNLLKDLVQRIDAPLHKHLQKHNIEYLQFTFRWMNNLLMRELPLSCTILLWDTYLSEPDGFASFHLYVCAAFVIHWSRDLLREKDFQGLMLMLQNLPTLHWSDKEINLLVAEAYRLKVIFADAPNHLNPQ